ECAMAKSLLFYDESFPYDGERPSKEALDQLREMFTLVDATHLSEALKDKEVSAYVHLHGPYFPKEAWGELLAFFQKGKGLLHVGGAPFRNPVHRATDGSWQIERTQTAYHRQIQIHEILPVDPEPIVELSTDQMLPVMSGNEQLFTIEPTHNLILHVTRHRDRPEENGSSGPMDAHIYPLLKGISKDDREVAAPVVLMENTKGDFAGGRWLFVNQTVREQFWKKDGVSALSEWEDYVQRGVTEIWVKPNYATYEPGDRASFTIQTEKISRGKCAEDWHFYIKLLHESKLVWTDSLELHVTEEINFFQTPIDLMIQKGQY